MTKNAFRLLLLALLLFSMFLMSGCQNAAVMAQRDAYVSYLEGAKGDFTAVNALLADKDLDLNDTSDDGLAGDALMQEIQKTLAKTTDYKAKIDQSIARIGKRDTAKNAELEEFAKSERRCLQLASDVLDEYGQICNYYITVTDLSTQMGAIDTLNFSDMQNIDATYKAFSEIIDKAVETLKNSSPPSFFKSVNEELIVIFTELKDSTTYALNAVILNDPLRMDAGAYRIQLLMTKKMAKAIADSQADVARRIEKLKSDVNTIKELDTGLTGWIDKNLKAMGA